MKPTFKKMCDNDPAIAIKALIESLSTQNRFPWLKLDFSVFNCSEDSVCYGCGATFTVLQLVSSRRELGNIDPALFDNNCSWAEHLDCDYIDLCEFEAAIDQFRLGNVSELAEYFGVCLPEPIKDWALSNYRGLEDLPLIVEYYDRLIANRNPV